MISCEEKLGGDHKHSGWPELALRWISSDSQLFRWPDRLPFCPPNWCTVSFTSKVSRSTCSPYTIHPDQSSDLEQKPREAHSNMMATDDHNTPNALSGSIKAEMAYLDTGTLSLIVQGEGTESKEEEGNFTMHMPADQVMMDVRVWSSLPEDIIEKVLAWLPLTSVLRFRTVCRRWNSVLLSGTFMSSHSKSSLHRQPCFLLCTIGQFACTFDPSLGKWLTLLKPTSPGATVIASTGSLFCLGNQVAECRVLSVCNPITRLIRHLPAMSKLCLIHKITMFEEPHTNSYTIVVAGEDGLPVPNPHHFNLITEVFESRSNAWHAAQDPPPEASFSSDPGVWFEGAFYCLTELPYGIVRFSAKDGKWEKVNVQMPASISMPSLVTVRNRLMMVGRCKSGGNSWTPPVIRIWELVQKLRVMVKPQDDETNTPELQVGADDQDAVMRKENAAFVVSHGECEWEEVMKMPRQVSDEFLAPLASYSPFVCAGIGSSIFLTTHLSPRVLVLDLSVGAMASSATAAMGCWSWLPRDPLFPLHRDFHLLGFSFEPRFDASP